MSIKEKKKGIGSITYGLPLVHSSITKHKLNPHQRDVLSDALLGGRERENI